MESRQSNDLGTKSQFAGRTIRIESPECPDRIRTSKSRSISLYPAIAPRFLVCGFEFRGYSSEFEQILNRPPGQGQDRKVQLPPGLERPREQIGPAGSRRTMPVDSLTGRRPIFSEFRAIARTDERFPAWSVSTYDSPWAFVNATAESNSCSFSMWFQRNSDAIPLSSPRIVESASSP